MKKKLAKFAASVLVYLIAIFAESAFVYWAWQMIAPELNLPVFTYDKIVAILIGLRVVHVTVTMKYKE